jgi:hypothetical protein
MMNLTVLRPARFPVGLGKLHHKASINKKIEHSECHYMTYTVAVPLIKVNSVYKEGTILISSQFSDFVLFIFP